MIIKIWKPVIKGKNRVIDHYTIIENIDDIKKGYKIIFKCDHCTSSKIHNSFSNGFLSNNKWNNMQNQMCRSCRSRKSEYEVKKTQIPWVIIKKSMILSGYTIITKEYEYNLTTNKSHFNIKSICTNGHEYKCSWNNWSKGKRCRVCYDENRHDLSIKNKTEINEKN